MSFKVRYTYTVVRECEVDDQTLDEMGHDEELGRPMTPEEYVKREQVWQDDEGGEFLYSSGDDKSFDVKVELA